MDIQYLKNPKAEGLIIVGKYLGMDIASDLKVAGEVGREFDDIDQVFRFVRLIC